MLEISCGSATYLFIWWLHVPSRLFACDFLRPAHSFDMFSFGVLWCLGAGNFAVVNLAARVVGSGVPFLVCHKVKRRNIIRKRMPCLHLRAQDKKNHLSGEGFPTILRHGRGAKLVPVTPSGLSVGAMFKMFKPCR